MVCSPLFKIPAIEFWHPSSFGWKSCWVTDCSLHLPKFPPSLSLSLFAILPSSFSQFICIWEFYWINREKNELGVCMEWNYPSYWTIKVYLRYWKIDTQNIESLNRLCFWVSEKKKKKKKREFCWDWFAGIIFIDIYGKESCVYWCLW